MTWERWPMIGILTEAAGLPDTDKLAAEVMDAFWGSLEIAAGHRDGWGTLSWHDIFTA
jgi:hypothetical protein